MIIALGSASETRKTGQYWEDFRDIECSTKILFHINIDGTEHENEYDIKSRSPNIDTFIIKERLNGSENPRFWL
jgi:hypothetical protein